MDGFLNLFDPNRKENKALADFFQPQNIININQQVQDAFDPKKNGAADAFDPKKNGAADAFDPHKNGAADAFDPKKNGAKDAFDPNKNGFNDFIHGAEDEAANFFNKMFGGGVMDKLLLLVGGVAVIMLVTQKK